MKYGSARAGVRVWVCARVWGEWRGCEGIGAPEEGAVRLKPRRLPSHG